MSLTTDPNDPALKEIQSNGQQASYLVLPESERAKGFVRPVRTSYIHVGIRPEGPTRELTPEEHERYDRFGYVAYEEYGEGHPRHDGVAAGRYWTKEMLESGCGGTTTMSQDLAETYARKPDFYGGTFCSHCGKHLRVGEHGEFVWEDGSRVGT